ncbi:unnamed protein product [Schistosoma margrebowiei]|uniref:SH2 domain-containing protein n=1 Tax=Schistosoma margrebowiei TaxID=48269 RepID=A0AA84ZFF0_9TREM|nr:unnamed protein product [Schistosoma margrebowiei]
MDMACVPLFNKQQCYNFEVLVKLHSLTAVPYVNSVTFAKLRLLNSRSSAQYSPSEHRFHCKFKSNAETTILDPNILKVSIRMETKGGKSFHKVGFVSINLPCFAAVGNVINHRRYILEGYDEKRKRQDNSLLSISFCLRQLTGDNCFRTPKEDLSNCLIEPPDFIELPETDSETREYSVTDCSLMSSAHNTTTTTNINNTSATNQNSNDLNILKPVDNSISKLTNNPLDILHSLNLDTVPSSCILSTPASSSSLSTETVSSTSSPVPLSSIADISSKKVNYSTSFSHFKMPSCDNSSVYPVGSSSCVSKSSVCQNELISSQTNINQSSNPFTQADQSQLSYCDRLSDSSSVTPISNSTSSTPCSISKGSLLLRCPLTLPLDKSIPSVRANTQQQNLMVDTSAVVELDKRLSSVIHDKPRSGQNVTFNILNPDNVTCYSLPNRHHLHNLCMTTDTPSDENRQNANIIETDPSITYSNYGKKSYDYFATDSVLLVRSSRRRRIRPDLQVLPSMNTDMKNTDPSSPNFTSATAHPSTSKSNPSDCSRPENDSSLSSISSSATTASTATVGVSQIMSKSGIPVDYYYSSGYQSHSRQSSLESQPVNSSPPLLSAEVCTQTQ